MIVGNLDRNTHREPAANSTDPTMNSPDEDPLNVQLAHDFVLMSTFLTAALIEHGGTITLTPESVRRAEQLIDRGEGKLTISPDHIVARLKIIRSET